MKSDQNKNDLQEFMGKKVLVVGGTGFIGRALVNGLLSLGAEVVSLSKTEDRLALMPAEVCCRVADLVDKIGLTRAIGQEKFDYVINAGGYIDHSRYLEGGRRVIEAHFIGTLNLLDLVYRPGLKRFIQIGSSDEYGLAPPPQVEDFREAPFAPYSVAKTGITHLIQALARTEGFPGVIVRLFLVYGPGQGEARFLPQVIQGCLLDRTIPTTRGEQRRDFCFIEDIVEGIILAMMKSEAEGEIINIASGQEVSIRNVMEKIVGIIGKGHPNFGAIPYRLGENMALYASIEKAKTILGWKPSTAFDEGLRKTIKWYEQLIVV